MKDVNSFFVLYDLIAGAVALTLWVIFALLGRFGR